MLNVSSWKELRHPKNKKRNHFTNFTQHPEFPLISLNRITHNYWTKQEEDECPLFKILHHSLLCRWTPCSLVLPLVLSESSSNP